MQRTPSRFRRVWFVALAAACACQGSGTAADAPAFDPLAGVKAGLGSPIRVEAIVEKSPAGDVLAITAVLEEGWHLYSLEQKPGGPKPTKIVVSGDSPHVPSGAFRPSEQPHRRTVDDVPGWKGLVVEEHSGRVTWRAPLAANPQGRLPTIQGSLSVQLCRDNAC